MGETAIPKAGDLATGTCRAQECKAPILWARTPAGAMQPLDPTPEKRVVLLGLPGVGEQLARVVDTYTPHHATCPAANSFRKGRSGRRGKPGSDVGGSD